MSARSAGIGASTWRGPKRQDELLGVGARPVLVDDPAGQFRERHGFPARLYRLGLQLRKVDHIADERVEMAGRVLGNADVKTLLLGQRTGVAFAQQVERGDDLGEWGSQFVRDDRQKCAFETIQLRVHGNSREILGCAIRQCVQPRPGPCLGDR